MIKYGSTTTVVHHVNYDDVGTKVTYTERLPVGDSKDILSEFLKLHKRYKDENLHDIGLKLVEKNGKPQFVDLTWTIDKV